MPLNAAALILARSMEPAIRVRPALFFNGREITYAELHAMVNRAANAFIGLGVARGERVPLLLNDSPLYVAAILGLMKIGAVAVPLNTRLGPEEYKYIATDCGAKLLVHDALYADALRELAGVKLLVAAGGADSLTKRMDAAQAHAAFAALDAEDPCLWLYSSGTTGRPKGIVHTQRAAAESSKLLREVLRLDETAVVLCTSKLFFAFALDNALFGVLRLGAATVLNESWPEPAAVAAQVKRIRPDAVLTVPTFFRRLLQLGEEQLAAFRDVPYYVTGGERLPDAVALQWRELTGQDILPCHGMSETLCNTFANFPGELRLGSCGRALAGVETLLLPRGARPGQAEPLGVEEPGMLWIRHPSLAARYSLEKNTAASFADGWFCTQDQFRVDAEGYWFHEGRADELLKIAGQWVKPQEVEDAVLGEHVREAACVVVADAEGFERLALYVVPSHAGVGLPEIEARAHAGLPAHSWPKWLRVVDELPRTPTGKLQRFRLREMLQAELWPLAATPPGESPAAAPAPDAEELPIAKKRPARRKKTPGAEGTLGLRERVAATPSLASDETPHAEQALPPLELPVTDTAFIVEPAAMREPLSEEAAAEKAPAANELRTSDETPAPEKGLALGDVPVLAQASAWPAAPASDGTHPPTEPLPSPAAVPGGAPVATDTHEVRETRSFEEASSSDESPVAEQAPASEQAPVSLNGPDPEAQPVHEQASISEDAPTSEQAAASEELAIAEEAPAVEEAPASTEPAAAEPVPTSGKPSTAA